MRIPLVVVSVVIGAGALGGPARAATADLATTAVTAPSTMRALSATAVTVKVRATGRPTSAAPVVTVLLSTNARRDKVDRVVGTAKAKGRLKAGRSIALRVTAVLPPALKPGSYVLLACVSAAGRHQGPARNDCRAAPKRIKPATAAAPVLPNITADETTAAIKTLDAAGGSIDVALPGGSHATLTVPGQALASPTIVSLVPVSSLAPGPRGITPVSSVLISPEGLVAPRSTLTFTAPAGTAAARLRAIAFGGEDEAIVAAPFLAKAALTVDAAVFGGYGIGTELKARKSAHVAAPRPCPTARAAATDPCRAESLRKRLDEILAGTLAVDQSALDAASAFVDDVVFPEIDAQIDAGATAEEIESLLSIPIAVERQRQLAGLPAQPGVVQQVQSRVQRTAENSLKRCEDRKQGPITTKIQLTMIERQAQLLGTTTGDLQGQWTGRCASKPWYLDYDDTVHETMLTSPTTPFFESGNVHMTALAVPVPGSGIESGQGPLDFSGLTCNTGSTGIYSACSFSAPAGDLQVQPIRDEMTTTETTRCGRRVKVPIVKIVLQFTILDERSIIHICTKFGGCGDGPAGGPFQRGNDVTTPGSSGQITLPDGGGRIELSGANPNFGGILAISAQGYAELKLTQ